MTSKTPIGEMWLDDGVLWHRVDQLVVSAEAAGQVRQAVIDLTGGRAVPAVIDIRNVAYADPAARSLFGSSPEESLELATALVVDSSSSRTMAQVFIASDKPQRPVRVFTSEHEAVAWARSFLESD